MKKIVRKTKGTRVEVSLARADARGLSAVKVTTGLPFFDHMLSTLLKYAGLEGTLRAQGHLPDGLGDAPASDLRERVSTAAIAPAGPPT